MDAAARQAPGATTPASVQVVPGRTRYHRGTCRYVSRRGPHDVMTLPVLDALTAGYVACGTCTPQPENAAGLGQPPPSVLALTTALEPSVVSGLAGATASEPYEAAPDTGAGAAAPEVPHDPGGAGRPKPSLLRENPRLRRLLASLAVSQAGDWLYNLALLTVVFQRSGSTSLVAATTVARTLPMIITGPLGGVLADRHDRRVLLIGSDVTRAVLMLLLAGVVVLNLPVALMPLLAALSAAASAPYSSCVAGTVPRLVTDAQLPAANALRSGITALSVVLGPALGAVLVLLGSTTSAFVLNAVSFAVSALLVLSLPAGALFAAPGEGVRLALREDLGAGIRALRAHPEALGLAGADVLLSGVYGALTVLLLLLSHAVGGGAGGYGLLLAAYGAGGLLGAVSAARAARYSPGRLVVVGLLLAAAPLALLGALARTQWLLAALIVVAVAGAAGVLVEVEADTALQRELPDEVFGRAYGFVLPACYTAGAAGAALVPLLVVVLHLPSTLCAIGAVVALYALVVPRRERAAIRALRT